MQIPGEGRQYGNHLQFFCVGKERKVRSRRWKRMDGAGIKVPTRHRSGYCWGPHLIN